MRVSSLSVSVSQLSRKDFPLRRGRSPNSEGPLRFTPNACLNEIPMVNEICMRDEGSCSIRQIGFVVPIMGVPPLRPSVTLPATNGRTGAPATFPPGLY